MNFPKNRQAYYNESAPLYDQTMRMIVPFYEQMLDSLFLGVPFKKNTGIDVLELGCGTGNLTQKIKERFPRALVECVDYAPEMIKIAQEKLARFSGITYQNENFSRLVFVKKYDVVLSSLALHCLVSANEKRVFYKKIFKALKPNGVFYNADVVLGSNDFLTRSYLKACERYCQNDFVKQYTKNFKVNQTPAKLCDHLQWLKEAGFTNVDVINKFYVGAVWGGWRKK